MIAPVKAPRSGRIRRSLWDINHPDELVILYNETDPFSLGSLIEAFNPLQKWTTKSLEKEAIDPFGELAVYCRKRELAKKKQEWQKKENLKAKPNLFPNPPDNPLLERLLDKRGTNLIEESSPLDKWTRPWPPSGYPASKGPDVKIPEKSEGGMFARMVDKLLRKFF